MSTANGSKGVSAEVRIGSGFGSKSRLIRAQVGAVN